MSSLKLLFNTLRAGDVRRFHSEPQVVPQTDSQHQWGVMVMCIYLTDGSASQSLMYEAAFHDTGELEVGDIPFTTKRDCPMLKDVLDELETNARQEKTATPPMFLAAGDRLVLKVADILEGLVYCEKNETGSLVSREWLGAYDVLRTARLNDDDTPPGLFRRADELISNLHKIYA